MTYQSTKTFGHDLGLSCAFRQWRADSHCKFIHGYALAFHIVFEATELDSRGWVVDFGGLKGLKASIQAAFDHKTVVAVDDPYLEQIMECHQLGIMDVMILPEGVGCERFAKQVYDMAKRWIWDGHLEKRVRVVSVECREHGANSAIYYGGDQ